MRHFTLLILTLAACFGAQALALRAAGGRTTKSESNYFSSLGRIQAGAVGKADVMLLGSSITGRLPDRSQGFDGFANMGCDGGSAVDALRAMDKGILPVAKKTLVIEANTVHLAMQRKPSEVGAAMESLWFEAGVKVPAVSAYARPSAFAYSKLLANKIGGFGDPTSVDDLGITKPTETKPSAPQDPEPLTTEEQAFVDELSTLLLRLKEKHHCRIVFALLPPGRDLTPLPAWLTALITKSGSEYWDLAAGVEPSLIVLTDHVHMSAPSAGRTLRTLVQWLR